MQNKILRYFELCKENKLCEEWDLYMKKSDIINSRNFEFCELEEFLVKNLFRIISKLSEVQQNFSFTKTNRTFNNS